VDNAAFVDDPYEVSRILKKVGSQIDSGVRDGIIRDVNGNKVGGFSIVR